MSQKKKQPSGLGAGIIAFGAVFALFSVLFKPHSLIGYAFALGLSAMAGAIIRIMAQGLDTSTNQKTPESLKKMQGETGDPDVDALLEGSFLENADRIRVSAYTGENIEV